MERFTSNKESGTIRCTICGGLISGELTHTGDNYCKGHENKQLNIGSVIISGCDKDLCEHNTGMPLYNCQYIKCILKT